MPIRAHIFPSLSHLPPSPPRPVMGNCTSTSDRQAKAHSDAIDKEIENDSKKFRKECKILLLGVYIPITVPIRGRVSTGAQDVLAGRCLILCVGGSGDGGPVRDAVRAPA